MMISEKDYIDTRVDDLQHQLDRRIRAHEHVVDNQIESLLRELTIAITTQKETRDKAEVAMNHRLEGMNEFRSALREQQASFVTIDRYDERHEVLAKRLSTLEIWQSNLMGRAIALAFIGSIIVALVTVIIYHAVG